MCGIVGYIGEEQAAPILLDGLSHLEYRGYDSAGIAVFHDGKICMSKAPGKLKALTSLTENGEAMPGKSGIGHTRWATHGEPNETNAHPHLNAMGTIAVVHNGIIENYMKYKTMLEKKGYVFQSDTDTEVIVHMLDYYYKGSPVRTIAHVMHRLEGSYALGILFADHPDEVYAARKDSPLIVGASDSGSFIASDVPAILHYTRKVWYMENGEIAVLRKDAISFYNNDGDGIEKDSV
ncbi:MAG: glutamine--fructose-6-phosphate aminotransferase, partial [Eubacterium sp.]|nr:glutamine--fructose-6-phosphate aminotransferase [Eubacterium sp.]